MVSEIRAARLFAQLLLLGWLLLTNSYIEAVGVNRIQHKSGDAYYLTSLTLTFNSPTTTGNTLIVAVSDYYATLDPDNTISDNKGNTWKVAVNYTTASRVKVYYAQNITGGASHRITVSTPSSAYYVATAVEYAGIDNAGDVVSFVKTNRASSAQYSTGSGSSAADRDLLFGVHHVYSTSATFTPDSPWTTVETNSNFAAHTHHVQDRVTNGPGSYASTGSLSASLDTQSVLVAFRAATSLADGTSPTIPANLTAVAPSDTQINLAWAASTDNVAVAGYEVERCSGVSCSSFALVGSTTSLSYADVNLTPATSYSYRVRAYDALTNFSGYSSAVSIATQAPPPAPTINTFTASPAVIPPGQSSTLGWDVTGAVTISLNHGIGSVTGSSTTVSPAATTSYTLTATNTGGTVSASVTVTVGALGNGQGTWTAICSQSQPCSDPDKYPIYKAYNYVMPYANSRGTLLFYGGYNNTATLFSNALWEYSVAKNEFNRLSWSGSTAWTCPGVHGAGPEPAPPYGDGHYMSFLQYDESRNRVLLTSLLCQQLLMEKTWTMDMSTLEWTELLNDGASVHPPGHVVDSTFVYDPSRDVYVGYGYDNLLFYFDPTTNTWLDRSLDQTGNIPLPSPSLGFGKLVYNTADQSVYFYGGQTSPTAAGFQNDLYRFDPTTVTWTKLNPVGGIKPPKDKSVQFPWMIYDSLRNRLVHYVDAGNVWQFSFADNAWSQLSIPGGPTIPVGSADGKLYIAGLVGYDPGADTMVVIKSSAAGYAYTGVPDVWELAFGPGTDTTAPTVPGNLQATPASASRISLTWTPSADNVRVVQYAVERCEGTGCTQFKTAGYSTSPAFTDARLTPTTTYRYRVRAVDSASNMSGPSGMATATTLALPIINSFTATPTATVAGQTATLSWSTTGATTASIAPGVGAVAVSGSSSVSPSTTTTYTLTATGPGGSVMATATITVTPDTAAPTVPGNLNATTISSSQIGLTWTASTDNVGVAHYAVERCAGSGCSSFAPIGTAPSLSYTDTGLTPSTTYRYRVRAVDAATNASGPSAVAAATTLGVPPVIDSFAATPGSIVAGQTATLAWTTTTATTVSIAPGLGTVSADGSSIVSPTATTTYTLTATNAVGSVTATATVTVTPDTTAPTVPGNVNASAISSSEIGLTWNASADDVGVAHYAVERCAGSGCTNFAPITTTPSLSYADSGLTPSTTYRYRVRAVDAATNASDASAVATATTLEVPPVIGSFTVTVAVAVTLPALLLAVRV